MTDKIQLKNFGDFLSEATNEFNHITDANAHYQSALKSKKLGHMKEYHSSMADAHTAAESHHNDNGSYKKAEKHGLEADAHMLKAGAAVNIREEAIFETFDSLFEDHLLDNSHISNAHAQLQAASHHLKNKNTDEFHNSMGSYHAKMAKHHNQQFDHHLSQSSKMRDVGKNTEADRHDSIAWAHSEAYDHHKRLSHAHSSYMKKKGKLLKEEVQSEIDSLLESIKEDLAEDGSAGAAPGGTGAFNSATSNNVAQKPMPLGALAKRKTAINEAKVAGGNPATVPPAAPSMSKSNDSLPSKRKSLGKLKESVDNLEEFAPLTESTQNSTIADNHKAAADAHKSAGRASEYHESMAAHHLSMADHHEEMASKSGDQSAEDHSKLASRHMKASNQHHDASISSVFSGRVYESETLTEGKLKELYGSHGPAPHIETEHHDAAMAHRTAGRMKDFHTSMSKHHEVVAAKLATKSKESLKAGYINGAEAQQKQSVKSKAHVDWHLNKAKMVAESLDQKLLEDFNRTATYASVAAKHKFRVKSSAQSHIFSHEDHGSLHVNRDNDTWEHNTAKPGDRQRGKVTTGSGPDALDSHLRKTATAKSVHI